MIRNRANDRSDLPEDCLERYDILLAVCGHERLCSLVSHPRNPAMHANPERPALVIELRLLRVEVCESLKSIIHHEKCALRFRASIDVMYRRERRKSPMQEPSLKELPVESLPIMRDDCIRIAEDLDHALADSAVVIHIGVPGRKVPGIYAVNRVLTEHLPATADN